MNDDYLQKELHRQKIEKYREHLIDHYRWNHPNRFKRWFWRLWMNMEF